MARGYVVTLKPWDVEAVHVYVVEGDEFDGEPELTAQYDEVFDPIVSEHDGYFVANVEPVDLEVALKNHPYKL